MLRVVLEGIPGAGKTSLARCLSEHFQCPLIPEWTLDELSWRGRRTTQPWYLVNEEARSFLAGRVLEPLVLFDRHYVGALAFDHALAQVQGDAAPYRTAFAWYEQALREGRIVRASHVFVLDVSAEISLARQPRAAAACPLFGVVDALEHIKGYYNTFYASHEPDVQVTWLDGLRPLEENLAHIVHQLESPWKELSANEG